MARQNRYEHVLGYELSLIEIESLKMAWFPMIEGAAGATETLIKAKKFIPFHEGTWLYFAVNNIEEVLKKVNEKGGKTINPKMSKDEHGSVAHIEDCDGNRIALHSRQ